MSEIQTLSTETSSGSSRRVPSIATKLRHVTYQGSALLSIVCLVAIGSMRAQSNVINHLVQVIAPAFNTNVEIFKDMTTAQAELLSYQVSHDPNQLARYRVVQSRVKKDLLQLHSDLKRMVGHSGKADDLQLTNMETIQRDAVERWFAYAQSIESAVLQGETTVLARGVDLFAYFQGTNVILNKHLVADRANARIATRKAATKGMIMVIAAAVFTAVGMMFFGLRLARFISRPIDDLRGVMSRQHAGNMDVRAREDDGSLDTRSLAHEFNVLVDRQVAFQRTQANGLRLHELTATIEQDIRLAANTHEALEVICNALAEGLGADRVFAYTHDVNEEPVLTAQWHLPDLPPLGDLADELVDGLGTLADELWQSASFLVSHERPAPEAQLERSKMFYRYTDAQAGIAVPIGIGDQAIGMVFVVMVQAPRDWEEFEIVTVQRVATFVARSIVEDIYRAQQSEHIDRLIRLDRQKGNFVATVSHELRTPLTSIMGYLEVLKDGYAGELTGDQTRMIGVMDRNAVRLLGLINNLLTLTQSESEHIADEVADVSMRELITEVCQELPPVAKSEGIELDIDAGPKAAIVQGERGQLKSVIANIVSNAIKFSRPGGVVTIKCAVDENHHLVRFTCQDRGIGIPVADQEELFTRFFRASNATEKLIPGTGLGLSIVQQIVTAHGGEVQLNSVEGHGTTVTVDLPLATSTYGPS
ncbi:MAG: ATP-binding protein [Actinomycetota bacterium]